ncbi:MAG: radical SAM family heme chaperone HemW [Anaerolineales bacterium]
MPLSLYLHIPFCTVRCSYCDFNTYAGLESLIEPYTRALAEEVRRVGQARPDGADRTVHSVFFGGGTPSLVPPARLGEVLDAIRESFELRSDAEITMEANPGTVGPSSLALFRGIGINRLSFGVQSAQPAELRLLDRLHTFEQVEQAVAWARASGFDNLNLDLIFGLPGQGLGAWRDSLERTLDLAPDHLSLYALSLEFGTPMQAWVRRGLLVEPDPDAAADMYEAASEALETRGFGQYEISNWARLSPGESAKDAPPRRACRHNLQYWRNQPYLGLGAGAHGFAAGSRYSVVRSPRGYLERIAAGPPGAYPFSPALEGSQAVDVETEMGETMMLGLRLTGEGVRQSEFRGRFGVAIADRYPAELNELSDLGLIERTTDRVRLTRPGRLLANRVFAAFV